MTKGAGAVAYGRKIGADGRSNNVVRFCSRSCAALFALLFSAGVGVSQPTALDPEQIQARVTAAEQIQARIVEVAGQLKDHPQLRKLTQHDRENAVAFVFGNMLFVLLHELAHAAIADLEIPVLGREEDAADEFAILRMIWVGSTFTHRVLADATKGWFFSARRDRKDGEPLAFYDEHSLDQQRAYHIVCLMVGHDPNEMVDLANEMKLPDDRRESCKREFAKASSSWAAALKPHQRPPERPKVEIETIYGVGKGELASFAQSFRVLRMLETVAGFTADDLAWPVPFTLEMQSCGYINARWNDETRKLTLCYELAQDFAELGRDFGKVFVAKQESKGSAKSLKRSTRPSFRGTRTSNGAHSRRNIAGAAGHEAAPAHSRAFKRHR
jgi:Putative metallopeptidase